MEQVGEDWWLLCFSNSKQALLIGALPKYQTTPDQCSNWSVVVCASKPSTGKMGGRGRWISVSGRSLAGKPYKLGEVPCQGEILSQLKCRRCLCSFNFLALLKNISTQSKLGKKVVLLLLLSLVVFSQFLGTVHHSRESNAGVSRWSLPTDSQE